MKSTDELPDDGLDGLFRASAEEFEPTYNPADWADLQRRLDDDARWLFVDHLIRWGLPLLVLLIAGVYFLLTETIGSPVSTSKLIADKGKVGRPVTTLTRGQNNQPTDHQAGNRPGRQTTDAPTPADPASDQSARPELAAKPAVERPSPAVPASNPTNKERTGNLVNSTTALNASKRLPGSTTRKGYSSIPRTGKAKLVRGNNAIKGRRVSFSAPEATTGGVSNRRQPTGQRPIQATQPVTGPLSLNPDYSGGESVEPPIVDNGNPRLQLSPNPASLAARPMSRPDSLAIGTEPYYEVPADMRRALAQPVQWSPFSIRVVGMPDLSFVGLKARGPAANIGVGILGEYQLSKRLIVQAGLVRSVKQYKAASADYQFSHWYYKEKPYRIDAVCAIIDLPINVRYNVWTDNRQRWFASGGVSSYYMQQEHYDYKYKVYDPSLRPYWEGQTGWFLASHVNFSVGYERTLSQDGWLRRVNWQVEPFLKAPLKGVGYGNVRLFSTGVFFSLRYRL